MNAPALIDQKTPEWRKRSARIALLSALRALENDDPLRAPDALGFALIAVTQLRHVSGSEERLQAVLEQIS